MDAEEQADLIDVAAAWLVALDAGSGDPAAFDRWRQADPRHAAAFAQVAATWSRLGSMARAGIDRPADPLRAPVSPDAEPASRAMSRRRWLQAASAVFAFGLAGIGTRAVARSSADTAVGERRSIRCDDGLRLELNTDTEVLWRSTFGGRHVWLTRGEIALDFATGPNLMLTSGEYRIELSPGQYNVRLRNPASLHMLVLQGRSMVEGGAVAATTGQQLLIEGGKARAVAAEGSERNRVAGWRRDEVVFADQPLSAAVDEYNRYLVAKLRVDDPRVGALRLGGRFTAADPKDFLEALTASFDVVAYRSNDLIVIGPAKNRRAE